MSKKLSVAERSHQHYEQTTKDFEKLDAATDEVDRLSRSGIYTADLETLDAIALAKVKLPVYELARDIARRQMHNAESNIRTDVPDAAELLRPYLTKVAPKVSNSAHAGEEPKASDFADLPHWAVFQRKPSVRKAGGELFAELELSYHYDPSIHKLPDLEKLVAQLAKAGVPVLPDYRGVGNTIVFSANVKPYESVHADA